MDNEKEIVFKLRVISNLLKRKIDEFLASKYDISISVLQSKVVKYLHTHKDEDVFQKDLEKVLNVRPSTVVEILKAMEKNDLIKKESVAFDARLKKITLTENMFRLCDNISTDVKNIEDTIKKGITEQELEIFFQVLSKIEENMK